MLLATLLPYSFAHFFEMSRHSNGPPAYHEELPADVDLFYIVASQIQEMELVRGKIFQLEQTHMTMKQK